MKKKYPSVSSITNGIIGMRTMQAIMKKFCGEQLGTGLYRDVFVLKQNPNYVVKIIRDPGDGSFANIMEWRNFANHRHDNVLGPYLASCEMINETGTFMVQERTYPGPRKDYPTHIPAEFTDLKLANFGFIKGKFKCHDYAYFRRAAFKPSMRYAKWWTTKKFYTIEITHKGRTMYLKGNDIDTDKPIYKACTYSFKKAHRFNTREEANKFKKFGKMFTYQQP